MLRWRLILGTLLIAALVILCWLDTRATQPGIFLFPLALVVAVLAASELIAMFRGRGHDPIASSIYAGTLSVLLLMSVPVFAPGFTRGPLDTPLAWMAVGLVAGLLITFLGELGRFDGQRPSTVSAALATLAIVYVGGLVGFIVALRALGGPPWGNDGRWGMVALVSLIATVKSSDTGQYAVGRLLGRNKLAPTVSPGKTWEGALGGVVFAVLAAWIVLGWGARQIVGPGAPAPDLLSLIIFAVPVAIAGILGDLAESMIKRDSKVKDSSRWMPGFGGVLDLLDSLLGAAPVVYLMWSLRVVGP